MAAFSETAFAKDTAFSSAAFDFGVAIITPTGPEGGVSGYMDIAGRKYRVERVHGRVTGETMLEATRRAESILAREAQEGLERASEDDAIALLLLHIMTHYY